MIGLLAHVPAAAAAAPTPSLDRITALTTALLHQNVDNRGKVDYAGIQRRPELLEELLIGIAEFDVSSAGAADRYAFYLNAYNVLVIGQIVRNYPLASVQQLPGCFDKTLLRVAGEKLTLDQIETDKLRRINGDPRLHFALVCGTNGCPRLGRTAYAGAQLSAQLEEQARFALLDPAYVQVDAKNQVVMLPELFRWHAADFRASGQQDVAYVNHFRAASAVPGTFTVAYAAYNWGLNAQNQPAPPARR